MQMMIDWRQRMSRTSLKSVSKLIDLANDEKSVEEQFLHDLCRSIELNEEKGWGDLPSKTFKPSAMNCMRYSYYQITGVKPDDGEAKHTMIGIANSGSDIHLRIQNAVLHMKDNGMDCEYVNVADFVRSRNLTDLVIRKEPDFENGEYETKLYNKKYNISFLCDGIIKYKGKYYILEIKSETSNKWYSRTGVDSKHERQAISYSLSLGLDNVIFLYVDRDMSNKKSYMFNVTDAMRESILSYIKETNGYIERHIVPPKDNVERRVCNYCNYQMQCRKDG